MHKLLFYSRITSAISGPVSYRIGSFAKQFPAVPILLQESRCTLCNPDNTNPKQTIYIHQEASHHQPGNGNTNEADPSFGRVGIYIGETSRSLAERVTEHLYDAESFYKKSHIIKLGCPHTLSWQKLPHLRS